jgi:hypothetical protein
MEGLSLMSYADEMGHEGMVNTLLVRFWMMTICASSCRRSTGRHVAASRIFLVFRPGRLLYRAPHHTLRSWHYHNVPTSWRFDLELSPLSLVSRWLFLPSIGGQLHTVELRCLGELLGFNVLAAFNLLENSWKREVVIGTM